ncbi:MAG: alpha/beta hydrolase [Catenulispora sp.]|nr:alpha/beta hydrolase [Catenulispora sp.]
MGHINVGTENSTPVKLYYEDHGAGRPVVLIHGWPLSGRSWEGQVGPLVAAGFRVITYDRRGFGASSQPWTGYDYDTFAADLNALMEQLDLREATLVGFSMGGGEVARYVGTFGTERVAQAVFAAAVPPYLHAGPDNPGGAFTDEALNALKAGVVEDRLAFLDGFITQFFTAGDRTDLVSPQRRDYHLGLAAAASPRGTVECITAFGTTDFRGDLGKFTISTLVIHGDSDAVVAFETSGARTHEAIPGCRLALIEGGPHGVNATHTAEFNAVLLDFLTG